MCKLCDYLEEIVGSIYVNVKNEFNMPASEA